MACGYIIEKTTIDKNGREKKVILEEFIPKWKNGKWHYPKKPKKYK